MSYTGISQLGKEIMMILAVCHVMVNFMCQLGWITGAQIAGKTLSLDGMVRMFPMRLTFESVN